MWFTSLLVEDTKVRNADIIADMTLSAVLTPILPPRALLVHILAAEDVLARDAYRSVICFALRVDPDHWSCICA